MALAYYLLKVCLCSALLFGYYHLALRNRLFHQWNRFYLLAAVLLSLLIPFMHVTITHEEIAASKAIEMLQVVESADHYFEDAAISREAGINKEPMIMAAYLSVCLVLLLFFISGLLRIAALVKKNGSRRVGDIRFVSTSDPRAPFSFFRYIFWNQNIDLTSETGQQIFQHELAHVEQRHSLDKLLLQAVLVVCWINPVFWLIRKELRMIHEFIADRRAVAEHGAPALAAMILQSAYPGQFNSATNHFFQTPIKRRLTMLTKLQHSRLAYLSRIIALPVIAITAMAFGLRTNNTVIPGLTREYTVVIDAGHGKQSNGLHSGARSENVYEDDIVLELSKKIQALNSNSKIKIILTRATDAATDLKERVRIAEVNKADLFISLHTNARPEGSTTPGSGIEVFVQPSAIHGKQSERLGSAIISELGSIYKTDPSLKSTPRSVYILKYSPCPAVLVECGYITDPQDKAFVTGPANQDAIAKKILSAINRYIAQQETGPHSKDSLPSHGQIKIEADNIDFTGGKGSNPAFYSLVVINGKKYAPANIVLDGLKAKSITLFDAKEGMKKFGEEGKGGVLLIEGAETTSFKEKSL